MAPVWIILWILGFIIILKDRKTESTKWLSLVLFVTGSGAFSVVLKENILIFLIEHYKISQEIESWINNLAAILSTFVHTIGVYCILVYGLTYANLIPKDKKKIIHSILLIPPILSIILLPIKDNDLATPNELILYFRQLSVWAVPYTLGSSILLLYSYLKEKSYIMKRYKLLTLLVVAPGFIYVAMSNFLLRALGVENNWRYFNILIPLEFIGFLYFAKEYGVLGVRLKFEKYKFAFEKILEFVSDSFVALDERLNIIEINKVFYENFITKNLKFNSFYDMIDCSNISDYKDSLIKIINESKHNSNGFIEIIISRESKEKYFQVQANPVIIKNEYFGTVLVFKDITVYKKNLELIKQNQMQLIEKERLLTLSHLMSGVAHNMKTPLMSSSGGIHIMKRDIDKIYEYIQSNCNDISNIPVLMDEINDWYNKTKEYLIYMSDVINTLKGQVEKVNEVSKGKFTIKELIDKISILMSYEFIKSKCVFEKEINIDNKEEVKGEINSLLQVLNNLLINAIEASAEGSTVILGGYKEDKKVVFYVKNFGKGIPDEVQSSIFNKMITTKGKNGTGLGLYISKSIIKGRFLGEIYFETDDKETTFFVKIPLVEEV